MGMFDKFLKPEQRSLENPNVPVSSENFLHLMGLGEYQAGAGVTINIENGFVRINHLVPNSQARLKGKGKMVGLISLTAPLSKICSNPWGR